ncbi:hypothetical protein DTO166G4_2861 [Paecilomyces variotii]|nr:hypothetical protein DTO166G4_2861 [Paecilomyces variotii]KAJ9232205.1 hypothetical protein DTO166G5_6358 [Paecilomyces variotii]KAJ9257536.1 hypothetical protein DTO195F2_5518 [Paecilomyces variotii]KAJ9304323.1 hypothetical protein DTO217A2_6169 [Paecilomyces variotii]KAJ9365476.1 hypothetical protein DTO280E4_445 [Paecilomyces variotii]
MSSFHPSSLPDLTGRVYVVTGGNTGLGYETTLQLATHGARVYLCSRSEENGNEAIRHIKERVPGADVRLVKMDLADLRSVVDAAGMLKRQEPRIHGLVNNAGIMATPYEKTLDGYEAQFQINYISHWLLTQTLLPSIQAAASISPPGTVRIVNVSSQAHHDAPSYGINLLDVNQNVGFITGPVKRRYGTLETRALHADPVSIPSEGEIWTASINPGRVDTKLLRRFDGNILLWLVSILIDALARILPLNQTVEKGAYTQLFAIASDGFNKEISGQYLENGTELGQMTSRARDDGLARELWEWTEAEMKRLGFV